MDPTTKLEPAPAYDPTVDLSVDLGHLATAVQNLATKPRPDARSPLTMEECKKVITEHRDKLWSDPTLDHDEKVVVFNEVQRLLEMASDSHYSTFLRAAIGPRYQDLQMRAMLACQRIGRDIMRTQEVKYAYEASLRPPTPTEPADANTTAPAPEDAQAAGPAAVAAT